MVRLPVRLSSTLAGSVSTSVAALANEIAALAFVNTVVATAGATLLVFGEWAVRGKLLLGACSGRLPVWSVFPACGYVGVGGALLVGLVAPGRSVGRHRTETRAARG